MSPLTLTCQRSIFCQRLFSLTLLKRSKLAPTDIVHIYCSKIRPILEYACPVWHGGLTVEQGEDIEHIQERALRIAHPGVPYNEALNMSNIPTLQERRTQECKKLLEKMQNPQDKLNRILPKARINEKNTRNSLKYPLPEVKTKRYKDSFLPYALFNCQ